MRDLPPSMCSKAGFNAVMLPARWHCARAKGAVAKRECRSAGESCGVHGISAALLIYILCAESFREGTGYSPAYDLGFPELGIAGPHFQIKSRFEATIEKRDRTREGQMSLKRELFLWKTFTGTA
jgi:hypothetical protein